MYKLIQEMVLWILCFYSPHFTSILLSEQDVLHFSKYATEFSEQVMTKYFELNNDKVNHELLSKKVNQELFSKGSVDLKSHLKYQIDYGSCTLICVHNKSKQKNIELPGTV